MHVIGVFCEDIRDEKTGQLSLVGIMPDNVTIPSPPPAIEGGPAPQGVFPKLALYIRAHLDLDDDPGQIRINLIVPDGNTINIGSFDEAIIEKAKEEAKANGLPIAGLVFHAVFLAFRLSEPGKIIAILDSKFGKQTCAVLNLLIPKEGS